MLLWPLRWLLRQFLSILFMIGVGIVGFLWVLRWVPIPPVPVMQGFFAGAAPQWGWISEGENFHQLRSVLRKIEESSVLQKRPTLAQRVAEQLFYPPDGEKWGSHLVGMLLHLLWGEERLLTFYLNSIPYDRDVYGVKAAANRRFQKSVEELSSGEMAELLLRRNGPPLSLPLSAPLVRECRRLERLFSTLPYGTQAYSQN